MNLGCFSRGANGLSPNEDVLVNVPGYTYDWSKEIRQTISPDA